VAISARTFSKKVWTLRDLQALFYAAWKSGGCPEITEQAAASVVTAQTMPAIRAGLIEAAESPMDEVLRGQRYVM